MSRILKFIPLFAIFLILVGFIHLSVYYSIFDFTINYWISLDEILVLFLDELTTVIFPSFLLVFEVAFLFQLRAISIKNDFLNNKLRPRNLFGYLSYGAQFGSLVYIVTVIIRLSASEIEKSFNKATALIVIMILLPYILLERKLNKYLPSRITLFGLMLTVLVCVLVWKAYSASYIKAQSTVFRPTASIVVADGRSIDSLIFVGKTRNYYFFYRDRKKPLADSAIVISTKCLASMKLTQDSVNFDSSPSCRLNEPDIFVAIESCSLPENASPQ